MELYQLDIVGSLLSIMLDSHPDSSRERRIRGVWGYLQQVTCYCVGAGLERLSSGDCTLLVYIDDLVLTIIVKPYRLEPVTTSW